MAIDGCWSCRFQQLGGISALGHCLYFQRAGRPPAEIPPHVVDVGCKFHLTKAAQKERQHGEGNDND